MDLRLKGLNTNPAGSNGGIGRKVADGLVAEYCNVAPCRDSQAEVDKITGELTGKGTTYIAEALDVTAAGALPGFINRVAEARDFISFTLSIWAKTAMQAGKPYSTKTSCQCAVGSQRQSGIRRQRRRRILPRCRKHLQPRGSA